MSTSAKLLLIRYGFTILAGMLQGCEKVKYKSCSSKPYKVWPSPAFIGYRFSDLDTIDVRYFQIGSNFLALVREARVSYKAVAVSTDTLREDNDVQPSIAFPDTVDAEIQLAATADLFRVSGVRFWGADTATRYYQVEEDLDCYRYFAAQVTSVTAVNANGVTQGNGDRFIYFRRP